MGLINNPAVHLSILNLAVFVVAVLYSAVGHGGASGYLAVLSLLNYPANVMSTTALVLNIFVASIAAFSYIKARHFSFSLTLPFLLGSVPAAFLGGLIHIKESVYFFILALTLVLVACRLVFGQFSLESVDRSNSGKTLTILTGIVSGLLLGLVSGIVGIGGGVFLTPLIVLMRWASTKQAACTSAVFIVVNSCAGLVGRFFSHQLVFGDCGLLLLPALTGGICGSYFGANIFSGKGLRYLLAVVLLVAAFKLAAFACL